MDWFGMYQIIWVVRTIYIIFPTKRKWWRCDGTIVWNTEFRNLETVQYSLIKYDRKVLSVVEPSIGWPPGKRPKWQNGVPHGRLTRLTARSFWSGVRISPEMPLKAHCLPINRIYETYNNWSHESNERAFLGLFFKFISTWQCSSRNLFKILNRFQKIFVSLTTLSKDMLESLRLSLIYSRHPKADFVTIWNWYHHIWKALEVFKF